MLSVKSVTLSSSFVCKAGEVIFIICCGFCLSQVMVQHLQRQLAQRDAELEQMATLKKREAELRQQVDQLQDKLREAKRTQAPVCVTLCVRVCMCERDRVHVFVRACVYVSVCGHCMHVCVNSILKTLFYKDCSLGSVKTNN